MIAEQFFVHAHKNSLLSDVLYHFFSLISDYFFFLLFIFVLFFFLVHLFGGTSVRRGVQLASVVDMIGKRWVATIIYISFESFVSDAPLLKIDRKMINVPENKNKNQPIKYVLCNRNNKIIEAKHRRNCVGNETTLEIQMAWLEYVFTWRQQLEYCYWSVSMGKISPTTRTTTTMTTATATATTTHMVSTTMRNLG